MSVKLLFQLFWSVAALFLLLGGGLSARGGETWAVIVGINDYGKNIPPLHYAVADANRLYALMTKGTPADHVILLTSGAQTPTGVSIVQSVSRLAKRAKPQDEFWFCFSGHGEDQNGAHYLLPSDVRISDFKRTAVNLKDLRDSLTLTCAAQHKMMIVDACHSGWDDLMEGQKGVRSDAAILWASCGAKESSWEIPELGEGVFTWFFLKKQQEINPDALRIPCVDDAASVNTHVATYIRRNKQPFTQTPQVIGALPKGGLIEVTVSPENQPGSVPPGTLVARPPLGPALLVEITDVRTQLNGTTITSEIAQSALRAALLDHNFPLVDPQAARQLEKLLDRKIAAAKAKQLGAHYLIRGRATTSATKMAITRDFVTVQATVTAEVIDETGNVLCEAVIGGTQDDPIAGTDITEGGASKMALQVAVQKLSEVLLPKLRAILSRSRDQ
jgi:hypothetical protein